MSSKNDQRDGIKLTFATKYVDDDDRAHLPGKSYYVPKARARHLIYGGIATEATQQAQVSTASKAASPKSSSPTQTEDPKPANTPTSGTSTDATKKNGA